MRASIEKPTVVICDPDGQSSVPNGGAFRIVERPRLANASRYHNVFVLATVTGLEPIAAFVSAVNRRNQLRGLFVRFDVDPTWLPQMFEFANLRIMRNTFAHSDFVVPHRVLRAWALGAQRELIADAKLIGDALHVVSCEPESYQIPVEGLAVLRDMPSGQRGMFEIADDGSYILWPTQDIHLDLDALLASIDPERRARAQRVKHSYGQQYGAAIARLRYKRGLKQTEIEGLSEREVRRIEADGDVTPGSLRKLAAAHELAPAAYMSALAKHSAEVREGSAKAYSQVRSRSGRKKTNEIRHKGD